MEMENLSFLIGNSPRTIKRYINIYRIIRTHNQFIHDQDGNNYYYSAAMILVGIITGVPKQSVDFFHKLRLASNDISFQSFMDSYIYAIPAEKEMEIRQLEHFSKDKYLNRSESDVLRTGHFIANMSLISRFSFYDLS